MFETRLIKASTYVPLFSWFIASIFSDCSKDGAAGFELCIVMERQKQHEGGEERQLLRER